MEEIKEKLIQAFNKKNDSFIEETIKNCPEGLKVGIVWGGEQTRMAIKIGNNPTEEFNR